MSRFFAVKTMPVLTVIAVIASCCAVANARAADLSVQSRAEIDYLFSYLKNSGCQFNRNEKWYGADEAVSHIDTKYKYLLRRDMLSSAEDFIDKAATSSSISGKFYWVKCGNEEPVQSGTWFKAELSKYRLEKH